ncbi:Aste57867_19368 [Aphanomyces stellatus]|uniref:Aste57867_19368 protein n=1 Tax=Aphanomyces stellatus TaxID=120398 RepID=A0A485LGM0_9STRA|nr:hypothetical protein As57867_019304 [Aphanomyces stellatus]VFT96082.1 Aste57867_19368 [Aphanomyces stellatus]
MHPTNNNDAAFPDNDAVDAAFARACADANERSLLELARLQAQRHDIRANLGITRAMMAQWTQEHQAMLASGQLADSSSPRRHNTDDNQ